MGWKAEWSKQHVPLILAFVCFFLAFYWNCWCQVVTERIAPSRQPPLPDTLHDILPFIKNANIPDYYLAGMCVITFIRFVVLSSLRLVILRRVFIIQAFLFFLRGVSVSVTKLSVPLLRCKPNTNGHPALEALYVMAMVHQTCADLLFSGHTATMTMCALTWSTYSGGQEWKLCCRPRYLPKWLRAFVFPRHSAVGDPDTEHLTSILAWLVTFGGYFVIIASHFHYSTDVWIGWWITFLSWKAYHFYLKSLFERVNWYARFFLWFEGLELPNRALDKPAATIIASSVGTQNIKYTDNFNFDEDDEEDEYREKDEENQLTGKPGISISVLDGGESIGKEKEAKSKGKQGDLTMALNQSMVTKGNYGTSSNASK